jgi:diguanylate cyclase (GGDEF)-like protein
MVVEHHVSSNRGDSSLMVKDDDARVDQQRPSSAKHENHGVWSWLYAKIRRVLAWLPEGRQLPEPVWQHRHRLIVSFALIQALALGGFGLVRGFSPSDCAFAVVLVAIPALLASVRTASRRLRTISATVSLMFASATFVDLAGGSTEAHFHFFVMLGVVALYQDWAAFGVCILITVLHHAVMGSIDPRAVYGGPAEWRKPILWALIHGAFVLASSVTYLIAWKANEQQELSDPLTLLRNRTAFVEQLQRALADPDAPVSVIFVDIDNFKQINDSAGHHVGDEALRHMAACMTDVLRHGDMVARLGGDEFAMYVRGSAVDAAAVAGRLSAHLQQHLVVDDHEIMVQASIGVADDKLAGSRQAEDLLRDADLAMYLAKSSGKNQVVIYTAGVDQTVRERAELAADIRHALDGNELEVYYQPVILAETGRFVGVEALVRWHHPRRGLLGPMEFIPLAEHTGEIRSIGAWVMKTAAAQVVAWQKSLAGCETLGLAVNISPVQFRDADLVEVTTSTLETTGLQTRNLTLEVTENALLQDMDGACRQLEALRALGVRVAIDDFGTGYSSLSYLVRLPVDVVKIDQSFVKGLHVHSGRLVLVKAIADLASALSLDIVAEGVEHPEEQEVLKQLGCLHLQGYYFSPPVPDMELAEWATLRFQEASSYATAPTTT